MQRKGSFMSFPRALAQSEMEICSSSIRAPFANSSYNVDNRYVNLSLRIRIYDNTEISTLV